MNIKNKNITRTSSPTIKQEDIIKCVMKIQNTFTITDILNNLNINSKDTYVERRRLKKHLYDLRVKGIIIMKPLKSRDRITELTERVYYKGMEEIK